MATDTSFDPVLLRTFLTVATGLSFTRAAEQLGLSQPTVSQHVRRLEEACRRQLLRRDTRSVALTDNHPFNGPLMVMPGSHHWYVTCPAATPIADRYSSSHGWYFSMLKK